MPKMNFDEIRSKYPDAYGDWSDAEIAMGYYKKYQMDKQGWDPESFMQEAGVDQAGIGQQGNYPEQGEPGTGLAGFGYDNPEIAAEMGKKDWKPWLDEVANAVQGKIASGSTFGVAPAIASRATGGESDKQLQRGTDILGPNLSFLLEGASGIPTSLATAPYMLSAKLGLGTEKFAPGLIAGGKRIIGNALDAVGINMGNQAIREGPASLYDSKTFTDMWDTAKAAGTWGVALETLLGMKRWGGKQWAQRGMNPDQKALDSAIAAVRAAIDKYGTKGSTAGMETVTDLLGARGPGTVNSLAEAAPEEYAKSQQAHQDRLDQAPGRFRAETERQAGGPLEDPKAIADKFMQDDVYQNNERYVPQVFDPNPKIPKISIWVEPEKPGGPKERATVPKGMGFLSSRPIYNMWKQAKAAGEQLAKSHADRTGRKAPGELENAWHTVLQMENSPDKATSNYGNKAKEILRGNHSDLDSIVVDQAHGHSQNRAVLTGQNVAKGQSHLLTTKARELTDPDPTKAADLTKAMQQGFWGELASAADKGDKLPRSSTATQRTVERVAGPTQGADFNEFLRQERVKVETDRGVANNKPGPVPFESPSPKSALANAASGASRMLIGAAVGGIPGAAWGVPSLLRALRVKPNAVISKEKATGILQLLREDINNMTQPRKKNAAESKGNMGALLPVISSDAEDARQKKRKARRQGYENSKEFLEGKD
jgi:hypothetical protein